MRCLASRATTLSRASRTGARALKFVGECALNKLRARPEGAGLNGSFEGLAICMARTIAELTMFA
ncbi:hypothetical protein OR16_36535 [Cupriavidus basilensis OR16]|uniref:Uncharacterized protein n=1 Tax=Cupriavidus basilensis OR16 TaxID=1127483 RepID=H1SG06_9BURK|nr:hypothetical protein OR16_36535 [Cupriavidus basilensis OR16]